MNSYFQRFVCGSETFISGPFRINVESLGYMYPITHWSRIGSTIRFLEPYRRLGTSVPPGVPQGLQSYSKSTGNERFRPRPRPREFPKCFEVQFNYFWGIYFFFQEKKSLIFGSFPPCFCNLVIYYQNSFFY